MMETPAPSEFGLHSACAWRARGDAETTPESANIQAVRMEAEESIVMRFECGWNLFRMDGDVG
jgi:hypothetical protein